MNRFYQFLIRAILQSCIPDRKSTDIKIALAFGEWLSRKGYLEAVPEEVVADSFGVSAVELSSFCRIRMGSSFRQLRKKYRIREAKLILAETPTLTLDAVGERVGIPDRSNFRKQFIEQTGFSPSEWVERNGRRAARGKNVK